MNNLLTSSLVLAFLVCASALEAQTAPRSMPTARAVIDSTPAARDRAYPGTLQLTVDASDTRQRIFHIKETIPVSGGGTLTLLYPEWLPGHHAPRGQMDKIAGIRLTANGRDLQWHRNPLDVYALVVDVPADAREILLQFDFITPTAGNQGRVVVTDAMLNLQWDAVAFYPAGYFVRRIPIQATAIYPAGWKAFTALRGESTGATVRYGTTDFETLIDSPVFAGKYNRSEDLGHNVTLNVVADEATHLEATPEQIDTHKKLVTEALNLFGASHFDHYDFLLALTNEMGGIGLEHHRSSENGASTDYFSKWKDMDDHDLLPHEFTHSWNGKFRRPGLLWTPDYRTPMQNDLLWVYEGQTQFWGWVLTARAGFFTKEQALDDLASTAAGLDMVKGRQWRPLVDTTYDPIIAARRPKGFLSWQRTEHYYAEGLLIWLEADAIIRRESKGARGLDDFAKAFFGMRNGDFGELVYDRADVIKALNAVQPYDWSTFLSTRVDRSNSEAPKEGITLGGYKLVYADTPNLATKEGESSGKQVNQSYGIGLVIANAGDINTVIWDSAAFKAGLALGMKVVAINGIEYSGDVFKDALKKAKETKAPIQFLIKQGKNYLTVPINYSEGLRYPRLEKTGESDGSLDKLLQPRS